MNKFLLVVSFISILLTSACNQKNNCEQLTKQFSTYDEAVKKIKSSNFKINEEANTSKSSWIKGASFYSCDGILGYFILITDKREYLYSEMPYSVWLEFKNAESFGSFYNDKIKHKYIFNLSK